MNSGQFGEKITSAKETSHLTEEPSVELSVPSVDSTEVAGEPSLDAQILVLEKELATVREDLLRSLADLDNMRKRSTREQEESRKYAVTHFARDVLSVSDNLERAISALPRDAENAQTKTVIEGLMFVQQELASLLTRHQIQKVAALHEKFDPHHHQAMLEIETEEQAPGTVIQVLQEGYMIADRLLRPALVGVAKAQSSQKGGTDLKTSD